MSVTLEAIEEQQKKLSGMIASDCKKNWRKREKMLSGIGGKDLGGEVMIYGYSPQDLDETIDAAIRQIGGA